MAEVPNPLRYSFRALRHRNFRLFLGGQFVSLIGTWLQSVALGWLLYRLTHSAFLLGLAGFLTQIPSLVLSPLAGVWADRWNRHRMVISTQVLAMVQALGLAALVLSHHEAIVPILLLNFLLGIANAADVPARQSFVVELVAGSDDLPNAIALNSSIFNLARLVGPALAGPLIALLGEGNVFLLNGLSYLAVIAALLAIRVPERPHRVEPWVELRIAPPRRAPLRGRVLSDPGGAGAAGGGEPLRHAQHRAPARLRRRRPARRRSHLRPAGGVHRGGRTGGRDVHGLAPDGDGAGAGDRGGGPALLREPDGPGARPQPVAGGPSWR